MRQDNRHTRVGINVKALGFCVETIHIVQNGANMCLEGIQSVSKVLSMVLLLGPFVAHFAGSVKGVVVIGIILQELVKENIPNLGRNVTRLGLDEQLPKFISKSLNLILKVNGLAEKSLAVIVKESILGKKWSGVCGVTKGNSQWGSSRNVVHSRRQAVSLFVIGNDNVGVGSVIEHICHGSNILHPLWGPCFIESGQSHIVGPLDDFLILDSLGLERQVSLLEGANELDKGSFFITRQPSSVWRKAAEAIV